MFEISRVEDYLGRNYYSLTVDEKYVEKLCQDLKRRMVNPDSLIPLTVEDVKNIWNDEDDCRCEEYEFKAWKEGETFKDTIDCMIKEWMEDDIYNNWVDSETIDTYGYEDEIFERQSS